MHQRCKALSRFFKFVITNLFLQSAELYVSSISQQLFFSDLIVFSGGLQEAASSASQSSSDRYLNLSCECVYEKGKVEEKGNIDEMSLSSDVGGALILDNNIP